VGLHPKATKADGFSSATWIAGGAIHPPNRIALRFGDLRDYGNRLV
jgi:hypothetical protein